IRHHGVGAFERVRREAGERFDLAEHDEPIARTLSRAIAPALQEDDAVEIPHERGADEKSPDLVVARLEEREDSSERSHLFGRAVARRAKTRLERLKKRRVEFFGLEEREHVRVARD